MLPLFGAIVKIRYSLTTTHSNSNWVKTGRPSSFVDEEGKGRIKLLIEGAPKILCETLYRRSPKNVLLASCEGIPYRCSIKKL